MPIHPGRSPGSGHFFGLCFAAWISRLKVLPLEQLLRSSWNSSTYLRGSSPESVNKPFLVADDGSKAHLQRINMIMASDYDWSTMAMISLLSKEAEFVGSWCEGCPCHLPPRHQVRVVEAHSVDDVELIPLTDSIPCVKPKRQRKLTEADREALSCDFRCCRAPELATGCALILQRGFMSKHQSEFNKIVSKLPERDRGLLAASWASATSKLFGTLAMHHQ